MRAIESNRLFALAQNVMRLEDLRPVLAALRARKIEPIALKGLALLSTVYASDPGARTMSDLDLLIEEENLTAAEEVLLALGYARVPHHQHTFQGGRGPTRIDLTAEIWYLDSKELASFRERALSVEHDRIRLRIPSSEDHFLFISTHAVVMHGHMRPAWKEDLRRIAALEPDWGAIATRARRAGLTIPLSLAIERVFGDDPAAAGVRIPEVVTQGASLRGLDRLCAAFIRQVLERPETHETGHLLRFLFRGGPMGKCGAILRHLFPGIEFIKRRYGARTTTGAIAQGAWRPVSTMVHVSGYALRTIALPRKKRGELS